MAAVLSHVLGADIWAECLSPQPPWHEPRAMLEALAHTRSSLGLSYSDAADFFGARDALWRASGELRRNRGRDGDPGFVCGVLDGCRIMLSTGQQCLAAKAAGEPRADDQTPLHQIVCGWKLGT